MITGKGFTVDYGPTLDGHLDEAKKKIYVSPVKSPTYIAGTIAHEVMHYKVAGSSWLEEYKAYLVGDSVRNDLITSGHGQSSDMAVGISKFTVDVNNPNQTQLCSDLGKWFNAVGLGVYVNKYTSMTCLPSTPTLTSTSTSTSTP
jgi:hypothetical protein